MRKLVIVMAAAFAIAVVPASLEAAPCKDAKGKFIKCPPAPAAPAKPVAKRAAKPRAKVAAVHAKTTAPMKKKGPCRDAKGRFAKCT